MNTKVRGRYVSSTLTSFWVVALTLIALVVVPHGFAATAANTTITNTVTVTYDNAANIGGYSTSASATVIVSLVAAAPTIDYPTDRDSTEAADETLVYTITGNANGLDYYPLAIDITNTNLSGETFVINGGDPNIAIGGTTLVADASGNTIQVPYDGNPNGSANGIVPGETIVINGNPFVVASGGISENSAPNITTITLTADVSGSGGTAGQVVGERVFVNVAVHTGGLAVGEVNGTHNVSATVTWGGATDIIQATPTVITVLRPSLTVNKYVRDISSDPGGTAAYIATNGPRYYDSVNAAPGATLEYIIVVSNLDSTGGQANNVVIQDPIPQFTSYVANSMRLDPDGTQNYADFDVVLDDENNNDPGEYDAGSERVWIYAGTGGTDAIAGYGTGTGGTLAAGGTTIGVFRVNID